MQILWKKIFLPSKGSIATLLLLKAFVSQKKIVKEKINVKNARNLKQHIKNVHEGKKDFKCQICGLYVTTNQRLQSHMNSLH